MSNKAHCILEQYRENAVEFKNKYGGQKLDHNMVLIDVREDHAMMGQMVRALLEHMEREGQYKLCVAASNCDSELPVTFIEYGSEEHFRAFARAGVVLGDGPMPGKDFRRKGQYVYNVYSDDFRNKIGYLRRDPVDETKMVERDMPYYDYIANFRDGRFNLYRYIKKISAPVPVIVSIFRRISRIYDASLINTASEDADAASRAINIGTQDAADSFTDDTEVSTSGMNSGASTGEVLVMRGLCLTKTHNCDDQSLDHYSAVVSGKKCDLSFGFKKGIPFLKGYRLNTYKIKVRVDDLMTADMQNRVYIMYDDVCPGFLYYSAFNSHEGKKKNSRTFVAGDKTIFVRQSGANVVYFTVRESCYFDTPEGKRNLLRGRIRAKFMRNKDIVLLYEKECGKYEESASILYEKLMDMGYKNAYFVLDRNCPTLEKIDPKYKSNIIYKHSLQHITYFFASTRFIGTETIGHAIQLRAANKSILEKIVSRDISYVFLQHGVMYMVSLNSGMRGGFHRQPYKRHRVVVSSELEAQHFIDLARFERSDLYLCGLPKFDTAYRYDDADLIVIMPTWRRWEVNGVYDDITATKYYKMIVRMLNAVPEDLRDKVLILPHPLMLDAVLHSEADGEIDSKYLPQKGVVYDEVLRKCRLLITDYSSISYDAYYRGSNVIFYWEEKEECMEHYGPKAFLLLNDDNAFGDVCYNQEQLAAVVRKNYDNEQDPAYLAKYRRIVEHHDGRNTERLIEMLKADGVI